MKYFIVLFFLLSCNSDIKNSLPSYLQEPKKESRINVLVHNDTITNISLEYWKGKLPDSVYLKPVFSIAIYDSSDIIIKDGFLKQIKHVGIKKSRVNGNDTLFIDELCQNLDYLYLDNLDCVITNKDSISIKRLYYYFNQKGKNSFALDLNKIVGLDSLYIYAPYENIIIPTDKNYKHITICSLNKQCDTLNKYYEYVDVLNYCE